MGFDSYLEIFTTMYGWAFSNIIMQVVFETGLFLLPVLLTMSGTVIEAYERGFDTHGVTWMVRKLQLQLYITMFMLFMCVKPLPWASLTRAQLTYQPPATVVEPDPAPVSGADTGSTYDDALSDTNDLITMPPWWYVVMSVSSGFTNATRAGVAGAMHDLRRIEDVANTATINDPRLRQAIQRFGDECYIPAFSRYERTLEDSTETAAAKATFGPTDVYWMGSHALRNDPMFYASMAARLPVPGFVFRPAAETDLNVGEATPEWGRPTCKQWWEEEDIGLRAQMVEHVSRGFLKDAIDRLFGDYVNGEDRVDKIARLALTKTYAGYTNVDASIGNDRGVVNNRIRAVTVDAVGAVGSFWELFKASSSMTPIINLLLMVQPMILMGIYMFLPIMTVFSGYSLKMFVLGALAIFTVKFWTLMWYVARWLDDHLIGAMHPNREDLLDSLLGLMNNGPKRILLNILLLMMFIGLPALWTALMGWAGFQLGGAIGQFADRAFSHGTAAGAAGAGVVKGAATKAMR